MNSKIFCVYCFFWAISISFYSMGDMENDTGGKHKSLVNAIKSNNIDINEIITLLDEIKDLNKSEIELLTAYLTTCEPSLIPSILFVLQTEKCEWETIRASLSERLLKGGDKPQIKASIFGQMLSHRFVQVRIPQTELVGNDDLNVQSREYFSSLAIDIIGRMNNNDQMEFIKSDAIKRLYPLFVNDNFVKYVKKLIMSDNNENISLGLAILENCKNALILTDFANVLLKIVNSPNNDNRKAAENILREWTGENKTVIDWNEWWNNYFSKNKIELLLKNISDKKMPSSMRIKSANELVFKLNISNNPFDKDSPYSEYLISIIYDNNDDIELRRKLATWLIMKYDIMDMYFNKKISNDQKIFYNKFVDSFMSDTDLSYDVLSTVNSKFLDHDTMNKIYDMALNSKSNKTCRANALLSLALNTKTKRKFLAKTALVILKEELELAINKQDKNLIDKLNNALIALIRPNEQLKVDNNARDFEEAVSKMPEDK